MRLTCRKTVITTIYRHQVHSGPLIPIPLSDSTSSCMRSSITHLNTKRALKFHGGAGLTFGGSLIVPFFGFYSEQHTLILIEIELCAITFPHPDLFDVVAERILRYQTMSSIGDARNPNTHNRLPANNKFPGTNISSKKSRRTNSIEVISSFLPPNTKQQEKQRSMIRAYS